MMAEPIVEQWRPIPGFEGYDVSNVGRVRSWRVDGHRRHRRTTPKLLKPTTSTTRRLRVSLSFGHGFKGREVHRLVAAAFIGPCPDGLEVCHNNGNHLDNRIENLRYDTPKGNHADRIAHGTTSRGELNTHSKLTAAGVLQIRRLYQSGFSPTTLAAQFGVGRTTISAIVHGRNWAWLTDEGVA